MSRSRRSLVVVAVLITVGFGLWLLQSLRTPKPQTVLNTGSISSVDTQQATAFTSGVVTADETKDDRQVFAQRLNKFFEATRPFGIEQAIAPEAIVSIRTNKAGLILVETRQHLAEFRDTKVTLFASLFDGSDTRRDPSAAKRWFNATAPWTQEQAINETRRLMQTLGIMFPVERFEYESTPLDVKTPTGETINVTPFHDVRVYTTNNSLAVKAEFRMNNSGAGRLTRWFDNTR